jgi:hypothetical protein
VVKGTEWSTFHDPDLGIKFSYPRNQKVMAGCHRSKNCVALVDRAKRLTDYIIALEVFEGGLEKVAVEQAVFRSKGNGWTAKGRFGEHPVEHLAGPGWRGLKATVDCGISDNIGFHAGEGECLWVVLSDGMRSVVADTQGISGIDGSAMRVIRSTRFTKP